MPGKAEQARLIVCYAAPLQGIAQVQFAGSGGSLYRSQILRSSNYPNVPSVIELQGLEFLHPP
eukprot:5063137-Amphidinium_carterae.3